jgi:hypothetical protein
MEHEHSHEIARASTTECLPVAPSMLPGLETVAVQRHSTAISARVVIIAGPLRLAGHPWPRHP